MNSLTLTTTAKDANGGSIAVTTNVVDGDTLIDIEREDILAGAVNVEFDVAITAASILAVAFGAAKTKTTPAQTADKTVHLVVKTNSTSAPANTFTITNTNGLGW